MAVKPFSHRLCSKKEFNEELLKDEKYCEMMSQAEALKTKIKACDRTKRKLDSDLSNQTPQETQAIKQKALVIRRARELKRARVRLVHLTAEATISRQDAKRNLKSKINVTTREKKAAVRKKIELEKQMQVYATEKYQETIRKRAAEKIELVKQGTLDKFNSEDGTGN